MLEICTTSDMANVFNLCMQYEYCLQCNENNMESTRDLAIVFVHYRATKIQVKKWVLKSIFIGSEFSM